jgi:hypothetical protein
MKHLETIGMNYLTHLFHAWGVAFILIVHGLFPNVWEWKASEILNENQQCKSKGS